MTNTYYHIEEKKEDGTINILFHSYDEETDECCSKFWEKKKALDLMKSKKLLFPNRQYRLVKTTESVKQTKESWI